MSAALDTYGTPATGRRRSWKRRVAKALAALFSVVLLLLLVLLLVLWLILGRIEQLPDIVTDAPADAKGRTILLVGTDRRSPVPDDGWERRSRRLCEGRAASRHDHAAPRHR